MEKLTVTARALPSSATTSTMLDAAAQVSPCAAWPGGVISKGSATEKQAGNSDQATHSLRWRPGQTRASRRTAPWAAPRDTPPREPAQHERLVSSCNGATNQHQIRATSSRTQSTHKPRPVTAAASSGASTTGSEPVLRPLMMRQNVALSSVAHAASMHDGVM